MINPLYVFLPMILLIGLISSYTDIKYQKISNKLILVGMSYAILVNISLAIYSFLSRSSNTFIILNYYSNYLINGIIAVILSFFMWKYKIWKGGDAKLFFAFVFLLPLSTYSNNYIDIFPALVLLINIFIPLAVFL